jgi:putative FmdB family regulatory protein
MPIYEFACHRCRSIFQFFARRVGDRKVPACPKCGRSEMERVLSRFAVARSSKTSDKETSAPDNEPSPAGGSDAPDLGDPFAKMSPAQQARAEREMFRLMEHAESLDERDPRQLGAFLRRMTEIVGAQGGPEMKEAIRRLEAGEDPEKIEEEYGDLLGMGGEGESGGGEYSYDEGLYDL